MAALGADLETRPVRRRYSSNTRTGCGVRGDH